MSGKENIDVDEIKQKQVALESVKDDPRVRGDGRKIVKASGGGRNTESFDPKSTLVRPEMRVVIGPNRDVLDKKIKHDDIVIVPEFFCKEDDWSIYYKLVDEMRAAQANGLNKSEWISWHEGAHLISMNPTGSPTFNEIQAKISKYFGISNKSVGTRFNWYKDGTDWKPFHHDSAAYNPQRARNQNITVGVSFGASRELAFLHTKNGSRIYFPQSNGMMFSFGRDVNINWKHGINALSAEEIAGGGPNSLGRVSIILWGLCPLTIEEDGSPEILTDNTRGNGHSLHAGRDNRRNDDRRRDDDRRERPDHHRHQEGRRDDRRDSRDRNSHRRGDRYQDQRGRGDSRDRASHYGSRDGDRDQGRNYNRSRSRSPPATSANTNQHRMDRALDAGRDTSRTAPPRDRSVERSGEKRRSGSPAGPGAGADERAVCRDFRRGSCRFGDRCKFVHD